MQPPRWLASAEGPPEQPLQQEVTDEQLARSAQEAARSGSDVGVARAAGVGALAGVVAAVVMAMYAMIASLTYRTTGSSHRYTT